MTLSWSTQQQSIFRWFESGQGSLVVRARAGTGKTTTIIEGIRHAPQEAEILLAAFNKNIAMELASKLDHPNAEALTMHSLGFQAVKRFWENIRVERDRGSRAEDLARRTAGADAPDAMIRMVAKLHTKAREITPLAQDYRELEDLAEQFECIPEREWTDFDWTPERVQQAAFRALELAKSRPDRTGIDFSDMLYLPIANNWLRPHYDLVVIDEAQDMNPCQIMIAQRVSRDRVCVVGDDRQAIYGFRGADSHSIGRLKRELRADECGLTTTYRCAKTIVGEAQRFVPDYEAADQNPIGSVVTIRDHDLLESVRPGDAVLSRMNAPLVSKCLRAIQQGIPARIEGRDIAAGLRYLIRKLAKGPARNSIPAFLSRLASWENRETSRIEASGVKGKALKIEAIQDKSEALRVIAEGVSGIRELEARLDRLFSSIDKGRAVVFSSVHKAKGLEWDKVFLLSETFRDDTREEDNISYVAITRAMSELVWVSQT